MRTNPIELKCKKNRQHLKLVKLKKKKTINVCGAFPKTESVLKMILGLGSAEGSWGIHPDHAHLVMMYVRVQHNRREEIIYN